MAGFCRRKTFEHEGQTLRRGEKSARHGGNIPAGVFRRRHSADGTKNTREAVVCRVSVFDCHGAALRNRNHQRDKHHVLAARHHLFSSGGVNRRGDHRVRTSTENRGGTRAKNEGRTDDCQHSGKRAQQDVPRTARHGGAGHPRDRAFFQAAWQPTRSAEGSLGTDEENLDVVPAKFEQHVCDHCGSRAPGT